MLKLAIDSSYCYICKYKQSCIKGIISCNPFNKKVFNTRYTYYINSEVTYIKSLLEEYLI